MKILSTEVLRFSVRIRYILRKINRGLNVKKLWYQDNGNWDWVKEKATPIAVVNRTLWRLSVPSFSFFFMLGLSAIISTFGLLANSVAVIIGAMIIAPLMGPIVTIAYATSMGNRKLLRRSSFTLFKGVILTVLLSYATALLINLETVDSEILSRTNPTLIDFGIALSAGMAGAFTQTRRSISSAIPGVAIAVALVPPLSVIGIGLALGEREIYIGSSLLFLTNLICIMFFGGLVFLLQSYGNITRAKKGLALSTIIMFVLGIPLTLSMRELILKKNVRHQILNSIVEDTKVFKEGSINSVVVVPKRNGVRVNLEIVAAFDSISQTDIDAIRKLLTQRTGEPINLQVKIIPMQILESAENL